MMEPADLFTLSKSWKTFATNHPKFVMFLQYIAANPIEEDTLISISITRPDGKPVSTNMKVTQSDLELVETLKKMAKKN
ncbi:MAG: hypothetical protein KBS81_11175 [Spirochaetales bacterium]|nr:hypothetical protein [Candidatus Physcosoma equi]